MNYTNPLGLGAFQFGTNLGTIPNVTNCSTVPPNTGMLQSTTTVSGIGAGPYMHSGQNIPAVPQPSAPHVNQPYNHQQNNLWNLGSNQQHGGANHMPQIFQPVGHGTQGPQSRIGGHSGTNQQFNNSNSQLGPQLGPGMQWEVLIMAHFIIYLKTMHNSSRL